MPNTTKPVQHTDAYTLERQKILRSYFQDSMSIMRSPQYLVVKGGDNAFSMALDYCQHQLQQDYQQLSFDGYLTLLELMSQSPTLTGFGLTTGLMKSPSNFGIYGYALMSSSSFEQWTAVADRIFNAIYEPLTIRHEVIDGMLCSSYTPLKTIALSQYIPLMEQVVLCGMALMKAKLPADINWRECVIDCNYSAPSYVAQYKTYFAGSVNFDAPVMQLCVPADWLSLSGETANDFIYAQCEKKIDAILGSFQSKSRLSGKVRHLLLTSSFNHMPSSERIAQQLNMAERTLRYQLAKEATSFRQILNEVRFELAKRYLYESDLSIQEIAFSLGYEHTQNFYRAFLKQASVTPEKFRQQHRVMLS